MSGKNSGFEKAAEKFKKEISGRVEERALMKRYTSFRIGGLCEMMVFPKNPDELMRVVEYCEQFSLPWRIIGRGSNLLVSDLGLQEVVINLQDGLTGIEQAGPRNVRGQAGARLSRLVKFCQQVGLSGLEWAAGIPGTVGGAIRMNAGAEKKEMGDCLKWVEFFRWPDGTFIRKRDELKLGYRKMELSPKEIILCAEFELHPENPAKIRERIRELLKKRRQTQPVALPSAGSVFKNPPGNFAGRLIEEVGLKGLRNGDAQVSELHANFIVNRGRAKAQQVLELIDIIKEKVKKEKGISLELEIELAGKEQ